MPAPYGLGYGMGAIGAGLAQGQLAATMMKPKLQHQQIQNQMLQQQMDEKQGLQLAAKNAIDPTTGQLDQEKYLAGIAQHAPSHYPQIASSMGMLSYRQAQGQKAVAQTEVLKDKAQVLHEDAAVRKMQFYQTIPQGQGKAFLETVAPELVAKIGDNFDYDDPNNKKMILNSIMKRKDQLAAEAREKEFELKQQAFEQKKLLDQSTIDYKAAKTLVDKQNAASNYLKALAMQTTAGKGQSPIDFSEGLTPELIKTLTPLLKMKKSNSLLDPGERDMAGELLELFNEVQSSTTPIVPTKRGTTPQTKPEPKPKSVADFVKLRNQAKEALEKQPERAKQIKAHFKEMTGKDYKD